jgi:predicted enzyme related to lactoylglutathione lyase
MSDFHGRFVWCELMTTDIPGATSFYRAVMGWAARDSGLPDHDYTILSAGETAVAGLMGMPRFAVAAGAQPGWIAYIAVDDVDAAAARVTAAGGAVHRAPEDIPTVGRFAVVADPQGAPFVLFRPLGAGQQQPPGKPGHVGWHELRATDREAAFAFYADQFGWTKADAVDMGPMGTYQIFAIGGARSGGMMTRPAAIPRPGWVAYFNVADIATAAARVKEAGGAVVQGPMPVPDGCWILHGRDPQGAMFALVGPGATPTCPA